MAYAIRRFFGIMCCVIFCAGTAGAQQLPPPVLTLDQEALFQSSLAARQVSQEIEDMVTALAAENRRIEAELSAEEIDLTERRPTLDPVEFRRLADAFAAKVEQIRAEQDAKERRLLELRDEERQNFLQQVTPILTEIAQERGALMILDSRAVFLAADGVDITDEAVARIDAAFSNGGDPDPEEGDPPAPDTAPEPEPDPEGEGANGAGDAPPTGE
ncbi:MAG: OmpH family outer membrane protein [Pseudomonadota bacterium]